jgi:hypothetical protein
LITIPGIEAMYHALMVARARLTIVVVVLLAPKPQLGWHPGAGEIGLVVVNLDTRDLRQRQRRVRQQARDRGRYARAQTCGPTVP